MPSTEPTETTPAPTPKEPRFHCRHLRVSGARCRAIALRGQEFCSYHHSARRPAAPSRQHAPIPLPLIEDRASIQIALNEIVARIANRSIDRKDAGLILYALQIASTNLPRETHSTKSHAEGPSDDAPDNLIDDAIDDPDLGPIAPVAQVGAEDEAHKSLLQKFIDYCDNPPRPCRRCIEHDRIEANKTEARRLIAERRAGADPSSQVWSPIYPTYPNPETSEPHFPEPNLPEQIRVPLVPSPWAPGTDDTDATQASHEQKHERVPLVPSPWAPGTDDTEAPQASHEQERERERERVPLVPSTWAPGTEPDRDPEGHNAAPAAHLVLPPTSPSDEDTPDNYPNPTPETWAKFAAAIPKPNASTHPTTTKPGAPFIAKR
jgi:hypothetical protein